MSFFPISLDRIDVSSIVWSWDYVTFAQNVDSQEEEYSDIKRESKFLARHLQNSLSLVIA